MTTKIDIIASDTQTSFSSVPTVQTQLSTDNTTKLASLGYVSQITSSLYLDKTSNQSTGGQLSITNQCTLMDVDTPVGANETLQIGETTNTTLSLPLIIIRGVSQVLRYWAVGTPLLTPTQGTAVICQKVQTGQVFINSLTSIPIVFSPSFASKPSIHLGLQGTTSTIFTAQSKWVTLASNSGFTARVGSVQTNTVLNWMAIGI